MTTPKLRNLNVHAQQLHPALVQNNKPLSLMKDHGFRKTTDTVLLPVTGASFVSLAYLKGEFKEAVLLDGNSKGMVSAENAKLLGIPTSVKYNIPKQFGVSVDDTAHLYVLGQLNVPRVNHSKIQEGLPKIKSVSGVGTYYMSNTANPKLAALLQFTAIEAFCGIPDGVARFNAGPEQANEWLRESGFNVYQIGGSSSRFPASDIVNGERYQYQCGRFAALNPSFRVSGLRIVSVHPQDTNYRSTIIWRSDVASK